MQWIKIFTFFSFLVIDTSIHQHRQNAADRQLQKTLAMELTIFVHGKDEYEKALETTAKLFSDQHATAESLTEEDLNQMEGIVKINLPKDKIDAGLDVVSLLAETRIFPSKGEARKTIQGGGISINRKKVASADMIIDRSLLLHKKYILLQKGKKNYFLISMI